MVAAFRAFTALYARLRAVSG